MPEKVDGEVWELLQALKNAEPGKHKRYAQALVAKMKEKGA